MLGTAAIIVSVVSAAIAGAFAGIATWNVDNEELYEVEVKPMWMLCAAFMIICIASTIYAITKVL